jgi:hypothetical protein
MMNITMVPGVNGGPDMMGIQIQKSQSAGGGLWYTSSWGVLNPLQSNLPQTLVKPVAGGDITVF